MSKEALDFLKTQRVGVLAVKMLDGSPHGATVHFAHTEDPFIFIFLTTPTYRKVEPLRKGKTEASFVVGMDEINSKTFQLDGIAELSGTEYLRSVYFAKFPEKVGKHPEDIFFTFTPTWWRYTDWTLPQGKTVFTSDGQVVTKLRS
jgi:hypothetical protein